jgi:type I restriction enzyme S subunit
LSGNTHKKLISIEGSGFTRINLRQDKLTSTHVLLPPLSEQEQIVQFLDKKTDLIDKLIKCIQDRIDLLKEKRLSLIDKVIHDKDIERVRLKYLVDLINRPVTEYDTTNYTRIGMYNWGRGIFKYEEEIGSELGDSDFSFIKEGDLILSGQFSWEGSVSLVESEFDNCIVSHRFHILKGKDDVLLNEYLWGYFTSQEGHFLLDINSNGFAGRNRPLNIGKLLKEKIPIPRVEIQNEIKKIVEIERMNRKYSDKLINLLQEYRQSLISNVVTGKIKVIE